MPRQPADAREQPGRGIGRHPRARVERHRLAEHRADAVEQRGGGEPAPAQLEQPIARVSRVDPRQCLSRDRHVPTVRLCPVDGLGVAPPGRVRLAPVVARDTPAGVLSGESGNGRLIAMNTATTPTRRPVFVAEAERERIWFFGGTVGVLVTGADTDERYAIVEQHLPAGIATPLHAHPDDEESFVVLTGEVVVPGRRRRTGPRRSRRLHPRPGRHAARLPRDRRGRCPAPEHHDARPRALRPGRG